MRALRLQMSGDPRTMLALVELPEPEPRAGELLVEPRAGELLVELLASPISPTDRLMVRGHYPLHAPDGIPGAQGVARARPCRPTR